MSSKQIPDKKYSGGTIFQTKQRYPLYNEGRQFLVSIHYRDSVLSRVLPKLARILSRSDVQGVSATAVLHHAIGFSHSPLTLTGLKFENKKRYKPADMSDVFLKKERALAEELLKTVFCDADSVADNARPVVLELLQTQFEFDCEMAFRMAQVIYHAKGSEPGDVIRVTIRGVGINSPSTMEFECSYSWFANRYRDFVHRSEV
jgi:hypothetical protein